MATVTKDNRGNYKTDSRVAISNGRTLQISTFKNGSGAVVSYVTAGTVEDGHFSFMMFGDFMKQIKQTFHKRITADVVGTQHDDVIRNLGGVKAEAEAFYAKEAA